MWLLETLIYVACMPTEYSRVDRASFMCFIFIVVRLLFTYIFILYLVSIVLTSGVLVLYC